MSKVLAAVWLGGGGGGGGGGVVLQLIGLN